MIRIQQVDDQGTSQLRPRLINVLERARGSTFYQGHLPADSASALVDQWSAIPFTQKEHLMVQSPDGFRALPLEKMFHYHESFGTVGTPMSSWYTLYDFDHLPAIAGSWAKPFGPGLKILNRFPYSFAVPAILVESIARKKGGIVIPAGNLNWNVTYRRTLELIEKIQPDILCGLPMEPVILWELARYLGLSKEVFRSIRHICLSGGVLTPAMTHAIESRFGAQVHNIYGSTEASGMASTDGGQALQLHNSDYFFEIVSPEPPHPPVPQGQDGILVVTTLSREAMPLVRYFTRDWVRPVGEGAVILLGRVDDAICHSGKTICKYELDQAILEWASELGSWVYFVVVTEKKLIVRLETDHRFKIEPAKMAQLADALGVPVAVELVPRDTLLHRPSLLKTPKVFKPQTYSDWRSDPRKPTGISEALIEWPRYSWREIGRLITRSGKRMLTRRRYNA